MSNVPQLSNKEWLSSIFRRTKLSPFGVAIGMLILNLLTTVPVALCFGAWFPSKVSQGLVSEPAAWLNDHLAIPVILAYFHWIQSSGSHFVGELLSEGIFPNSEQVRAVLEKGERRLQSFWVTAVGMSVGLVFTIWFILTFTRPTQGMFASWVTVHPAIVWIRAPMMFVSVYALAVFVYDLAIIVLTLNGVFRNQHIRVEPLHPDGAGGLAPIGRFSSTLGYLVGMIGLAYSVRLIQQNVVDLSGMDDYAALFGLALYLLLSPILFFLPLQAARSAMVSSRDSLLKEISMEFDTVFSQIHSLRSTTADKIEPLLKRYRQIEETRAIVKRFPVWPFNAESMRKFFGLVVSPILPAIVSIILDLLSN